LIDRSEKSQAMAIWLAQSPPNAAQSFAAKE
jgi:hypothetical protein